nr:hypothetical protein [Neobacillus sp. Marseille-Q6967]
MRKIIFGVLAAMLSLAACGQKTEEAPKQTEPTEQSQDDDVQKKPAEAGEKGSISSNRFFEPFNENVDHIHGIGYAGNQNAVFFAAHDGLKVYDNGKWFKTKEENNDYMGFNATEKGFYSSGHPGPDSELPNPIGIKRSMDNGKTLEDVALEGEIDFHLMGVGYLNNTIFVLNPEKNSLMDANKYYVSEDEGKTWKEAKANGLNDEVIGVAMHPEDSAMIAAAGKKGIYLSRDKGENFELVTNNMQGTAVFFTKDSLWYGSYTGTPNLVKRSLTDNSEVEVPLPEMEQDAVLYFAQNPQNEKEMTFVSFKGIIYQTADAGETWNLLASEGKLQ